jgi:hypothetical protein
LSLIRDKLTACNNGGNVRPLGYGRRQEVHDERERAGPAGGN